MTLLPTRRSAVAALLAAGAIGLAACGSDDSSSSSSGSSGSTTSESTPAPTTAAESGSGENLSISADESGGLSFNKKTLSAKAGSVTITMANPSADKFPHAVAIEGGGVDKDGATVQPGKDSTVTVDLKPGKYTFYCPVPGHRQAGMEGTLTVQ